MEKRKLYMTAGIFAAGVIVGALILNPQAAATAITGAFALLGTALAALAGMGT
jgi:hypothetical protein